MGVEKMQRFFVARFKGLIHIIELVVVATALILAAIRIFTLDSRMPRTRTDTMALAMGAKSLIVILYQMLSEHVQQFRRFYSPKANLILNTLEIVFWAAVAFMGIQANMKSCNAKLSCGLSWAVLVLAILLSNLSAYVAGISFFIYREHRQQKNGRSNDVSLEVSPQFATEQYGKIHSHSQSHDYYSTGRSDQSPRAMV